MKTTSRPKARFSWLLLAVGVLVVAVPTTSNAQPAPTCQSACQRLASCNMQGYVQMCVNSCKQFKYEAEAGRKTLLLFSRMSCKQLQTGMASVAGRGERPSPRGGERADLDQLDRELGDLERQLGSDEQELERRSRGARAPAGPAPGAPQRGSGGGGKGRTWWMCTAEASLGTAIGDGPMTYRVKSSVNNGPTKEEAALKALKDCGAIVGASMAIDGGESRHEGGTCEISRCISGQ